MLSTTRCHAQTGSAPGKAEKNTIACLFDDITGLSKLTSSIFFLFFFLLLFGALFVEFGLDDVCDL